MECARVEETRKRERPCPRKFASKRGRKICISVAIHSPESAGACPKGLICYRDAFMSWE
ncbi:hypothetical protein M378DRAFT_164881 [Amanita muscaria Koide BX008]|uniref:Uncharacterized protein n=1 Tax=Amanita muscaria (strain Koide BX008) TaxID=946122 RepID=A0A0C2T940_AMAMK|nr:hypothetical protein M378DRAFT_164881 [Amanita muscaria Koide BX008]